MNVISVDKFKWHSKVEQDQNKLRRHGHAKDTDMKHKNIKDM